MSILQVVILAVVQGLAELLPVSSSAHVVVAEKLMGLNPSAPEMPPGHFFFPLVTTIPQPSSSRYQSLSFLAILITA